MKAAPAVAILINSPGGSAVQSHLIYKRIRALAAEKKKTVIVAVEDVAASGGYMIALAGDEIVVDASSIVGSIGVVFAGFGFQQLIEKVGIERRVYTAGEAKVILDPFQPEKEEDVARLKTLQREVHASFIDLVKSRRPRLADDPDIFTGAFWSGERAVALGLADRVGDLHAGAPGEIRRQGRAEDDRRREGVPAPAAGAVRRGSRRPDALRDCGGGDRRGRGAAALEPLRAVIPRQCHPSASATSAATSVRKANCGAPPDMSSGATLIIATMPLPPVLLPSISDR